jgi:hypothetical protein
MCNSLVKDTARRRVRHITRIDDEYDIGEKVREEISSNGGRAAGEQWRIIFRPYDTSGPTNVFPSTRCAVSSYSLSTKTLPMVCIALSFSQ